MIDLVSESVGGSVVYCNDDFFAPAANLIKETEPVWKEGEYTDRGKWMDGWESRRRRDQGHDWCDIALGIPGRVEQVVVDTSHFIGNYPESFSLEAIGDGTLDGIDENAWSEIIPRTALAGDSIAGFEVSDPHRVTHVRFKIHPDGGVARLRIMGSPIPALQAVCPQSSPVDLASSIIGGEVVDASDLYFSPPSKLLRPPDGSGMWDGWETKRRRGPGNDWVTVRLGAAGHLGSFVVDTRHFKGNAPGWVSIDVSGDGADWVEAVPRTAVSPDQVAIIGLDEPVHAAQVRLNIYPDGGLTRFRVMGRPDPGPASGLRVGYVNALFDRVADRFFLTACASRNWVKAMNEGRPFRDSDHILSSAGEAFGALKVDEWLEAFAGHPRIGEEGDDPANSEQAAALQADQLTLQALREVNREYEEKFGHTYIVYATGKTAGEMLDMARSRLENDSETELAEAAAQQRRITETRLRRMLCLEDVK